MDRNSHKILLEQYFSLGGSEQKVKSISAFSLANHAKLKYFIKQLNAKPIEVISEESENKSEKKTNKETKETKRKSIFFDLISHYPVELHHAYKLRYDHWLEACSLKVMLNDVDIKDEETALDIQWKIFNKIQSMNKYQKALEYYNKNKRILETETKVNFDDLSPIELIKKRQNLRSNITKRMKTFKQMESKLPEKGAEDYNLKLHLLNRKKEEIEQLKNMVTKLDEMIG